MKDSPILFKAEMVRAILAGTKTQTRRVIKKPEAYTHIRDCAHCCPHGAPGDQLWVKETIRLDDNFALPDRSVMGGDWGLSHYAADGAPTKADAWPWQKRQLNSIHCPRGLSRIQLQLTEVRVEQLGEISDADAIAEGIEPVTDGWRDYMDPFGVCIRPRTSYFTLWDSINGAGAHHANPWVWVEVFKEVGR